MPSGEVSMDNSYLAYNQILPNETAFNSTRSSIPFVPAQTNLNIYDSTLSTSATGARPKVSTIVSQNCDVPNTNPDPPHVQSSASKNPSRKLTLLPLLR